MTLWKRLRQLVLQYPTVDADDCEKEALMRELYITSGEKQNRYFYSQYSDFSDVSIDFGSDGMDKDLPYGQVCIETTRNICLGRFL